MGLKDLFKKKAAAEEKDKRKSIAIYSPRGSQINIEPKDEHEESSNNNNNSKDKYQSERRRHVKRKKSIFDFFTKSDNTQNQQEDDQSTNSGSSSSHSKDFLGKSHNNLGHNLGLKNLTTGGTFSHQEEEHNKHNNNEEEEGRTSLNHDDREGMSTPRNLSEARIELRRRSTRKSYTLALDVQSMANKGDNDAQLLLKFYKDAYTREAQIKKQNSKDMKHLVEELKKFETLKRFSGSIDDKIEENIANLQFEEQNISEEDHHSPETQPEVLPSSTVTNESTTVEEEHEEHEEEEEKTEEEVKEEEESVEQQEPQIEVPKLEHTSSTSVNESELSLSQREMFKELTKVQDEKDIELQKEMEERLRKQQELEEKMKMLMTELDSDEEDDDEEERKHQEELKRIEEEKQRQLEEKRIQEEIKRKQQEEELKRRQEEEQKRKEEEERKRKEEEELKRKQEEELKRKQQEEEELKKKKQQEEEELKRKQEEELKKKQEEDEKRKKNEEEEKKRKEQLRNTLVTQLHEILHEYNQSGKLSHWIESVPNELTPSLQSEIKQATDFLNKQTTYRKEYNNMVQELDKRQLDIENFIPLHEIEVVRERVKNIYINFIPRKEIEVMKRKVMEIEDKERKRKEEIQRRMEKEAEEKRKREKEQQQGAILQRMIKDGNIHVISEELKKNNPTLKAISLQNKNIGNEDVIAIADALVENTNLTELDLSFNTRIDDDSVNAIVKIIKHNHTLRKLYLEDTFIRDNHPIVEAVAGNFKLVDMVLSDFATDDQLDQLDSYLDRNEVI
ncbi:hypothetical protein ABK040_007692 [Willaertia magna]